MSRVGLPVERQPLAVDDRDRDRCAVPGRHLEHAGVHVAEVDRRGWRQAGVGQRGGVPVVAVDLRRVGPGRNQQQDLGTVGVAGPLQDAALHGHGDGLGLASRQRHPPQPPDAAVEVADEQVLTGDLHRLHRAVTRGHHAPGAGEVRVGERDRQHAGARRVPVGHQVQGVLVGGEGGHAVLGASDPGPWARCRVKEPAAERHVQRAVAQPLAGPGAERAVGDQGDHPPAVRWDHQERAVQGGQLDPRVEPSRQDHDVPPRVGAQAVQVGATVQTAPR